MFLKISFYKNKSNLLWSIIMNKDKKWMLMTYYCPTHGDVGRVEPLQLTREELSSKYLKKSELKKEI